jgi:hypothetical protein
MGELSLAALTPFLVPQRRRSRGAGGVRHYPPYLRGVGAAPHARQRRTSLVPHGAAGEKEKGLPTRKKEEIIAANDHPVSPPSR